MTDQKLEAHFHFDAADSRANRNGQFSVTQRSRLFGRHDRAVRQKRVASAILIPASVLMLAWMIALIYQARANGSDLAIGTIIFLGLFGGLFLLAGSYIFRISFISPTYVLKKVEGPINIVRESQLTNNGMAMRYELHVAGEVFNLHLDSTASDVMSLGDTYAIYYSQGAETNLREILSAELISRAT